MAYSQRFSLREELPSQQPEDISQSISHSAITLPKFVYLMSELGVAGPRQRGRLGLESSFYTYLGEGAQFQAYRHTEVEMVAKRITLSNMVASNSEQLLDLELEIRALADERVYEHPNIVDLLDWGYDVVQDLPREIRKRGDVKLPLLVPVLYVEPASEGSLKKFLESSRDWATRVRLCLDIAAGLECLRECQILHNDLKPENILIFGDGDAGPSFTAKLADFGHARASDGGRTLSFVGYGRTPKWKPPESEDYDSELHGDFHSEMLFKSESYAYGMLALYTLFSPPKDHPSSPKDQSWSPEGQNSSPFNRNRIKREEEITARIEDHEDTTLREDMIKTWRTVESNFLAEQPKDRHDVSPSELGLKG
jgi:serine/threonine protein kinase